MPLHVILAADPLLIDEQARTLAPEGTPLQRNYADELDYDSVFAQLGSRGLFDDNQAFHYVNFLAFKFGKKEQDVVELLKACPRDRGLLTALETRRSRSHRLAAGEYAARRHRQSARPDRAER
jgi:DNA polymerase III delta subunit